MKLFIWKSFIPGYETSGLACAIADDVESAREEIRAKHTKRIEQIISESSREYARKLMENSLLAEPMEFPASEKMSYCEEGI
jgi:hypothetical protein